MGFQSRHSTCQAGKIAATAVLVILLVGCATPDNSPSMGLSGGGGSYDGYDDGIDQDCSDIRRMVWVGSFDPDRLDRDGDGWGCESYGG